MSNKYDENQKFAGQPMSEQAWGGSQPTAGSGGCDSATVLGSRLDGSPIYPDTAFNQSVFRRVIEQAILDHENRANELRALLRSLPMTLEPAAQNALLRLINVR